MSPVGRPAAPSPHASLIFSPTNSSYRASVACTILSTLKWATGTVAPTPRSRPAHFAPQVGGVQEAGDGLGQGIGIARGDEHAGDVGGEEEEPEVKSG